MHGNVWEWVWEWVWDLYDDKYSPNHSPKTILIGYDGPSTGEYRTLRGGSFGSQPLNLRSADRDALQPTNALRDYGFRCVRGVWLPERS